MSCSFFFILRKIQGAIKKKKKKKKKREKRREGNTIQGRGVVKEETRNSSRGEAVKETTYTFYMSM